MAYSRQAGNDFSDGGFLTEKGWYHLIVMSIEDPDPSFTGVAFEARCEVLAGSVAGQEGKSIRLRFNEPMLSHKDGGKFAAKCIDRFAIAVGLLMESEAGKNYAIDNSIKGRHFVAHLVDKLDQQKQPTGYLQVDGAATYHVDDPAVVAKPKNAQAMAMAAPWRRILSGKQAAPGANGRTAQPAGFNL